MKNLKIFTPLLIFISSLSYSQIDKSTLGLGPGFEYGGLGINYTQYVTKNTGIFGGLGYAKAGAGFDAGVKFRFFSENKRSVPYLTAMYGLNTMILVSDVFSSANDKYNKLFYGPTLGFGFDVSRRRTGKKGYWSLAVLLPIRGANVDHYLHDLRTQGIIYNPAPIVLSVGYRFILKKD